MRIPNSVELLSLWEDGVYQSLLQKTISLLFITLPELNKEEIENLSIGTRDAGLLLLRKELFGSILKNETVCPNCIQHIEWEMDCRDLQLQPFKSETQQNILEIEMNRYHVSFRLPNSQDISNILDQKTKQSSSDMLLSRCIIEARRNGSKIKKLPAIMKRAVIMRMEKEEPQANIQLNLICSNCKHEWILYFDILSYLWTEINEWAKRMLQDVTSLSRAFGWSEGDVLKLSPFRRQIYLSMVNL